MQRPVALFSLWLAYTAFVVYGSLVPLDWRPMPFDQALAAFRHIPFLTLGIESRADWIANGVLYAPLGFLSASLLLTSRWRLVRGLALPVALAGCLALAVGVEFTQLFFPPRTVSLNDLIAEGIGSLVGVAASPLLLAALRQLQSRWQLGGRALGAALLLVYAIGYPVSCFFPFDLLLSAGELQQKINSPSWGWLLADIGTRPELTLLQFGLEIALAAPYGFLLARLGKTRRLGWAAGALAGLLLGLLIESGQFLIASGITQGVSVLSRVAGVMLGLAAAQARAKPDLPVMTHMLLRHIGWLGPAYLAGLALVNGWFRFAWQGMDAAAAQFGTLRLMPFYYHYYTTEAHALYSLGIVALMYLPVAVFGFAWRIQPAGTVVLGTALCLLVETSKLFLAGSRPDPTNLLIAAASCALVSTLLRLLARQAPRAVTQPARQPEGLAVAPSAAPPVALSAAIPVTRPDASPAVPTPPERMDPSLRSALSRPAALAALALALAGAAAFPFTGLMLALLAAASVLVWVRPALALVLIPGSIAILDLAPWSGRFYWDEFDLLSLTCLAVVAWRTRPAPARWSSITPMRPALALLAVSLTASTAVALMPFQWPDLNSFNHYYSPYNALRIVKGALWAWAYVWMLQRLAPDVATAIRLFGQGLCASLAFTLAFIVWERSAFVGLADVASDFRISGPISAMHKGGAYIECFLAVASAFALSALMQGRTRLARAAGALLLIGATYGVAITFSRNGYAAFGVMVLVMLGIGLMSGPGAARPARMALVVTAVVAAIALPILAGPFAQQRLAQVSQDLQVRQAHWADALSLRDTGWTSRLLGAGIGRFPDSHFWKSTEPVHAASYRLGEEGGNRFLRLGGGATIYVEQIIAPPPGTNWRLTARVRSSQPSARSAVMLCRKWLLTSAACASAELATTAQPGQWQRVSVPLDGTELMRSNRWAAQPLKFALTSPGVGQTIDIDDVRLDSAAPADLLVNGDFSAGLDRWFFSTDVDPPWHIHSLPVAVLFDQGWLGMAAWSIVLALGLASGFARARQGQPGAAAVLAALLAFGVSGTLNTLIDAPRFLWLLLVLIWLCAGRDSPVPGNRPIARG